MHINNIQGNQKCLLHQFFTVNDRCLKFALYIYNRLFYNMN